MFRQGMGAVFCVIMWRHVIKWNLQLNTHKHTGKLLDDTFSTHNGLKQGEALPSLLLPAIVWRWQYNTPGDGKARHVAFMQTK